MPQQRETTTDRLANVIQVIQLGRKTGLLTVERGEGVNYEEGFLTFVQGHLTQAQAGPLSYMEAFKWMNTWGTCRFAFIPQDTGKQVAVPGTPPPNTPRPAHLHGARPVHQQHHTRPIQQLQRDSQRDTPPGLVVGQPNDPTNNLNSAQIARNRLNTGQFAPRSFAPQSAWPYEEAMHRIEQIGLSRTHRRLFLLLDGKRELMELARLMGRNDDEVRQLLSDLERAGIIRF